MTDMEQKFKDSRGTGTYDEKLNKICLSIEPKPFFGELHPELLPYVGRNYDKTKILLIGESHYVESATDAQWKATNWYHAPLPENAVYPFNKEGAADCFDTRQVLCRYMIYQRGRGHTTFSNPTKVFCEITDGVDDRNFDHFAFMNFFQRPALKRGKSIDYEPEEVIIANEILEQVIQVLKPQAVIFLSKKARCVFKDEERTHGTPIYVVDHPTCAWWNRKHKNGKSGKDDFTDILKELLLK